MAVFSARGVFPSVPVLLLRAVLVVMACGCADGVDLCLGGALTSDVTILVALEVLLKPPRAVIPLTREG